MSAGYKAPGRREGSQGTSCVAARPRTASDTCIRARGGTFVARSAAGRLPAQTVTVIAPTPREVLAEVAHDEQPLCPSRLRQQ